MKKLILKLKKIPKNRHFFLLAIVLAAAVGIAGYFLFLRANAFEKGNVTLTNNGFSPDSITVHKGETVTFKTKRGVSFWPASNTHPSHGIYPEFDPKRALSSDESWSFTFTKPGRWGYHDHLTPSMTGTVIVLEEGAAVNWKTPTKIKDCTQIEEVYAKSQCWDELLTYTLKRKGLAAAFDIFIDLYQTDPEIPKSCHGWGHILGKAAYDLFKDEKKVVLRPESSYCGYGFYHGFMESSLLDSGNLGEMKAFCEDAQKQISEDSGVYINCVHGIGHGSVNIDDPSIWGNFQAMLEPGLANCAKILTTPGDLLTCQEGAFNAMTSNVNDELYGLSLDRDNFFGVCRGQEERYKKPCYFEFLGLVSAVAGNDFDKAAKLLLRENLGRELEQYLILKLAGDFMQYDIVNPSYEKTILQCRNLPSYLYKQCFNGVLTGFTAHGDPERAYIKGLVFCEEDLLTEDEKKECYRYIVSTTVPKDSDVCKTIPEAYREYCQAD